MTKLIRRFSSWEEVEEELEDNLKNSGLFIKGEYSLEVRAQLEVELWLPRASEPIFCQAEVVGIFPSGVALEVKKAEELIQKIEKYKSALSEKELESREKELELSNQGILEEASEQSKERILEQEASKQKELEESEQEEDKEDTKALEQRLSLSGSDYSNLYQAVRKLSKAEKIQLAKRGSRRVVSALIQLGDRALFRFIIQNPHLSASEVLQLLKSPQLTTEIIQELVRNPGWVQNEEIRYQIVIHPKTPLPTALNLLSGLNARQLAQIAKSKHIRHQIKSNALKLVLKRQSRSF